MGCVSMAKQESCSLKVCLITETWNAHLNKIMQDGSDCSLTTCTSTLRSSKAHTTSVRCSSRFQIWQCSRSTQIGIAYSQKCSGESLINRKIYFSQARLRMPKRP